MINCRAVMSYIIEKPFTRGKPVSGEFLIKLNHVNSKLNRPGLIRDCTFFHLLILTIKAKENNRRGNFRMYVVIEWYVTTDGDDPRSTDFHSIKAQFPCE